MLLFDICNMSLNFMYSLIPKGVLQGVISKGIFFKLWEITFCDLGGSVKDVEIFYRFMRFDLAARDLVVYV